MMELRMDRIFGFLGNGDPQSAKVWFIGIEEAKELNSLSEIDEYFGGEEFKTSEGYSGKFTPVYNIISKVILGLQDIKWQNKDECSKYCLKRLFSKGSEAVQLNLYPLGKKSLTTKPDNYLRLFGLSRAEYHEAIRSRLPKRLEIISRRINEANRPLTICFGNSSWAAFSQIFLLKSSDIKEKDNYVEIYPEKRVVLTPFFRYGKSLFSDKLIGELLYNINRLHLNPY